MLLPLGGRGLVYREICGNTSSCQLKQHLFLLLVIHNFFEYWNEIDPSEAK